MMQTAAKRKGREEKQRALVAAAQAGVMTEEDDDVYVQAQKARAKRRERKPSLISQVQRRSQKLTHEKTLPENLLQPLIAYVQEQFPGIRFNERGSREKPLSHRIIKDKFHPEMNGYGILITTSGNRFFINPNTKEIFEGDNNNYA